MKLIVDFDSFIYRACYACEDLIEVEPGIFVTGFNTRKGYDYLKTVMNTMMMVTSCNEYIICLSDWRNFRKEIVPTYKSNRKTKPPVIFDKLKEIVYNSFDVYSRPYLEADDLCRQLYEKSPRDSIISSIDKDMETFPCRLLNPDHVERGVKTITKDIAFKNFSKQLIMGDKCDGYEGIKGMGEARTRKLLEGFKTIDDVFRYYLENGYTEEYFRDIYNQAYILGDNEIGENKLELYGGELWTIPQG